MDAAPPPGQEMPTRRAAFLSEMEQVVPWADMFALIEPFYPKVGNGRPPYGLERMLRIYFLQQWFNLSDPGVEEALYESATMRDFGDGLRCGRSGDRLPRASATFLPSLRIA
jgi:IS5 family transposase